MELLEIVAIQVSVMLHLIYQILQILVRIKNLSVLVVTQMGMVLQII